MTQRHATHRFTGRLIPLLLAGFATGAQAGEEVDRGLAARASASVLQVEVTTVRNSTAYGSGVALGGGKLATSCHGTIFAKQLAVISGAKRWKVVGQIADVEHDVCILSVPGLDAPAAVPASAAGVVIGDAVFAFGHARGGRSRPTLGKVVDVHPFNGSWVIESSAQFSPGDSGGGLFNTRGELVGLLTYIRVDDHGAHHFSVPADWIAATLAKSAEYGPIKFLGDARPFWAKAEQDMPFFMRASFYATTGQWDKLATVADAWSVAEPNNTHAHMLAARAARQLARQLAERDATARADREVVRIDPTHAAAKQQLALPEAAPRDDTTAQGDVPAPTVALLQDSWRGYGAANHTVR